MDYTTAFRGAHINAVWGIRRGRGLERLEGKGRRGEVGGKDVETFIRL